MSKRTIEIDDDLDERVETACDEVKDLLLEYLNDNPDTDSLPCMNNDLDYSGRVHEIVDGSVPIYTANIDDLWYLYASELEEAYENAGVGDNPRENNGMAAIYYYIWQQVNEWWNDNAEDVFDEWYKKNRFTCSECGEVCITADHKSDSTCDDCQEVLDEEEEQEEEDEDEG